MLSHSFDARGLRSSHTGNAVPDPFAFGLFAILLLLIGLGAYVFYQHPWHYGYLISEDEFGESTSFIAFMLAGAAFAYSALKAGPGSGRTWLILLALGSWFLAMEEVS